VGVEGEYWGVDGEYVGEVGLYCGLLGLQNSGNLITREVDIANNIGHTIYK